MNDHTRKIKMFKQLIPLKHKDHAELRMQPAQDYGFLRDTLVAPIIIDEIGQVAREYPIVFPVGSDLPVALMGVQKNGNAYVASSGQWLASYIPAHIRHYPLAFSILPTPEGQAPAGESAQQLAVLVDMASALISQTDGELLFGPDGQLSGRALRCAQLMQRMHLRTPLTRVLVGAIADADLLVEVPIRIQHAEGNAQNVKGLRTINETALNRLDPQSFLNLRAAGALPLVYAALLSWANFRQGPIGRSHPQASSNKRMDNEVIRFS